MRAALERIRAGLREAIPELSEVLVVDPRFPAEEVRAAPPAIVLVLTALRRNGSLMGGPPTAWRAVPNPEYPAQSPYPWNVEFIWADENVYNLTVHVLGSPKASWAAEDSAIRVAERAWMWFRGPARFALEGLAGRVVNMTPIPAVPEFAPFEGTAFGLSAVSFAVEVLLPTVVVAQVPTVESVDLVGRYFSAVQNWAELRRAAREPEFFCELPSGGRILVRQA